LSQRVRVLFMKHRDSGSTLDGYASYPGYRAPTAKTV